MPRQDNWPRPGFPLPALQHRLRPGRRPRQHQHLPGEPPGAGTPEATGPGPADTWQGTGSGGPGKPGLTWWSGQAAIDAETATDGWYALLTNLDATETAAAVLLRYKAQEAVERRYGNLKGPLAVAQMFLNSAGPGRTDPDPRIERRQNTHGHRARREVARDIRIMPTPQAELNRLSWADAISQPTMRHNPGAGINLRSGIAIGRARCG